MKLTRKIIHLLHIFQKKVGYEKKNHHFLVKLMNCKPNLTI